MSIYQEIKPNNKNIKAKDKKSLSRKISDRVIRVFVTNPDGDDDDDDDEYDDRRRKQKSSRKIQQPHNSNTNVNYRKKISTNPRPPVTTSSVKPPHFPRGYNLRERRDDKTNKYNQEDQDQYEYDDEEDQNEYYIRKPPNGKSKNLNRISKLPRYREENNEGHLDEFTRNKNMSRINVGHNEQPQHHHNSIPHNIENRSSSTTTTPMHHDLSSPR